MAVGIETPAVTPTVRGRKQPAMSVDDPMPKALTNGELMRAIGISNTTFYVWLKAGVFAGLELAHPIGRKRWSGREVRRRLDEFRRRK